MAVEQDDLFWAYVKAASPLTDAATLTVLSFCEWVPIRRRVAANRSTPENVLHSLAVDPSDEVKVAIACNCACPNNVIDKVLANSTPQVRLDIARNADACKYALEKLIHDKNSAISAAARLTLRLFHAPGTATETPPILHQVFPVAPGYPPPDLPIRTG